MLTLTIGRRITLPVASLDEASDFYCNLRDQSCEGASTFPAGKVKQGGKVVADIFYNGRIFPKAAGLIAA